MASPEHTRSSMKRNIDDHSDVRNARARSEERGEGDDKRKHRSNKTKKSANGEEAEGLDSTGRKRSNGDRNERQKRSGSSTRAGSDEDDHEARSKQMKEKQEESALDNLSNWYQDGETKNNRDGGDKSGSRGHDLADENDRKKSTPKLSEHESSQSRSKGKDKRPHEGEFEMALESDLRYSERKDSRREKGSPEEGRNLRRRLEESDTLRKAEESNYAGDSYPRPGKSSDFMHESSRVTSLPAKILVGDRISRELESNSDKGKKLRDREEFRVDSEHRRSEAPKVEDKRSPPTREDVLGREKLEEHRQQGSPTGRSIVDRRERSFNAEELREKSKTEMDCSKRGGTPEKSGRRYHESEMDYEKGVTFRRKELEKDGYKDDRPKGRGEGWSDRTIDRGASKDDWKRRNITEDTKDGHMSYDHGREWELQRRGHERIDNERPQGRAGGRKDGNRTEAVKTSSNYGISNDNYDVIEIQTKPFDYGREESRSTLVRGTEGGRQMTPNDEGYTYSREIKGRNIDLQGSAQSGEDSTDKFMDDCPSTRDHNSWRDEIDFQASKERDQKARAAGSLGSSGGSQPPRANQEASSFSRAVLHGRGSRGGRGGRSRSSGRDSQQGGMPMPMPMMGPHFGPLGMPPPGAMQPLTPSMSPGPGPPISPGVFIPPFSPPVWPGARGIEMNILGVQPGLSPVPHGPTGPRFSSNMGTPPSAALYYNQPGPGRGVPPNVPGPNFNAIVPLGRGQPQDKAPGSWVPPRTNAPPGRAPSRGEQNDYSQNFVDTGMRPQNFIRELELTNVVEDYPRLRELIQKKDEIVAKSATPPMYYKCDLREQALSPEFFGTKFDVILVDPPWEEYVHRAPGVTDHMDYWTFEEIMNLKIEAIADTPSFIFLWVGDGPGLEQGRQCLKKWGFRRCEDICWVKTNKTNATPGLRHDARTLFQRSKEHCLLGIKGTVRRSTDGHIIHANIDTDVIIGEEPPYGSTAKPEDMYRIVEHFSLGRRRLELFGEDHNIRSGWLTVGKDLSSSNFSAEAYVRNFADKDGKVWQGGGGRNPPPEAGHLVVTTPDIEALRPKSPMKNQLQLQQQHSNAISLTASATNRRPTENSPQNYHASSSNQEASSSNFPTPVPWGSAEGFKGREGWNMASDDRGFDMYGYNASLRQANGDYLDFESQRAMNLL
ncbi:hypothetical protein RJ639_042538 [Escallonia herrerae]|uniref:Methyltransferase-like protein 1 n=1 Tax=Escallonia herrerae TaxID=1293975 RepID=A0AA88WE23_9ASTE|nr:hypothetical protein RJ639_042538 [Escallonia herrerae]